MDELLLLSGNDFPIKDLNILIHQPTIKEIAFIGEESFFQGCEMLKFSKNNLAAEDRNRLEKISDFNILMSIIREKNPIVQQNVVCMKMVLALLFPTYEIQFNFDNTSIDLIHENMTFSLNENNYDTFRNTLNEILCLGGGENDFNPSGSLARKIADKLKDRHAKMAASGKENQKIAILSRYVSILAVGENKDMNALLNYSIYQLFDEFKRYNLKVAFDTHFQAQLAGAKDLKDVEDWMKDIHSDVDD